MTWPSSRDIPLAPVLANLHENADGDYLYYGSKLEAEAPEELRSGWVESVEEQRAREEGE